MWQFKDKEKGKAAANAYYDVVTSRSGGLDIFKR